MPYQPPPLKPYTVRIALSNGQEQTKEVGALDPLGALTRMLATQTLRLRGNEITIYLNGRKMRHFLACSPRHEPPRGRQILLARRESDKASTTT